MENDVQYVLILVKMNKHMHIYLHMQRKFLKRYLTTEKSGYSGKENGGAGSQWKIFDYLIVFKFIFYTLHALML